MIQLKKCKARITYNILLILQLGEFVDEYTVRVIDVFAMPQSGTGVSVEAVDPVFQARMLDMLRQTGRPEMVVGWYHSHPGFGKYQYQVLIVILLTIIVAYFKIIGTHRLINITFL